MCCEGLTTLPESLDDLLWRKAHEKQEELKMKCVEIQYSASRPKIVFSPKMKQALELLKQNGVRVTL